MLISIDKWSFFYFYLNFGMLIVKKIIWPYFFLRMAIDYGLASLTICFAFKKSVWQFCCQDCFKVRKAKLFAFEFELLLTLTTCAAIDSH